MLTTGGTVVGAKVGPSSIAEGELGLLRAARRLSTSSSPTATGPPELHPSRRERGPASRRHIARKRKIKFQSRALYTVHSCLSGSGFGHHSHASVSSVPNSPLATLAYVAGGERRRRAAQATTSAGGANRLVCDAATQSLAPFALLLTALAPTPRPSWAAAGSTGPLRVLGSWSHPCPK